MMSFAEKKKNMDAHDIRKSREKAFFTAFICLTVFSLLLIVGASFVNHFIPHAVPIYTTMHILGGLGAIAFGIFAIIFGYLYLQY